MSLRNMFRLLAIGAVISLVGCGGGGGSSSGGTTPPPVTTYTIAASAGTGGSITPSGTITVNSGASQVYSITPAAGNVIQSVLVDGVSVGAVPTYTFSNVTANHTITASFIPATKVIVKLATTGTLPAGTSIGGIDTTVTYPTNKGLSIFEPNVVLSGVATGASVIPNVSIPGEARLALITGTGFGVGEFATLTFSIAVGNTPVAAGDFAVAPGATVLDATNSPQPIPGISVVIQSITFQ